MLAEDFSLVRLWPFVAGAALVWYSILTFTSWYRLRHIPGPTLASFSYLWLARVAASGKQYQKYRGLNQKYGPLVRVGPNELTTDDPEVLRMISGARSSYGKDDWYLGSQLNPYVKTMFTTMDPGAHDRMRAQTAGAYSGREATNLEKGVDEQVQILLSTIRDRYISEPGEKKTKFLDFSELSSFFTIDVITNAGFGRPFGYLPAEKDLYGFLESIRDYLPTMAMAVDVPFIRNILFSPTFLKVFGPKTHHQKGMGRLMHIAANRVKEHLAAAGKDSENTMLSSFFKHGYSQEQCEAECIFMIFAGSDTTASVMRTTMLYLISTPHVYQKFKSEVAAAVRAGVSSPITVEQARAIPYLQALIYEGLRMRSPAPGLYPKTVPPEGDIIHGKLIPGGTAIGMNTSSVLCSKTLFGEDTDVFRPERFLEVDEPKRVEMERNVELIFGYGRWMCAGKPIAFMELNKVFFELMRHFDWQLVNPASPWHSVSYSVWIEQNMWVRVFEASPTE
ncbi:BcABA1, cytochrome P450 monooxygenase [Paraphaeosphaeria sporulosa]|uniref:BcABA1, cytochrome P450 monooxygenase n=1 Tax=Paraphaeosphaeria sporulosa TaxID=1460663 RepID=A0A177BXQ1_9PLEO|nr:BcABA1, cytochrome P450 monooxygenase [Paraphaeosphaeria sporulosa]OAF99905.1 BcABA1, cytochrome P450 monooxygenase [Paraphaeosphaeria sporulosa]